MIEKFIRRLEKTKILSAEQQNDLNFLYKLREIKAKKVLVESDIEQSQTFLCYGSLAYCCGLDNKCPYRDSVRDALGIDNIMYTARKDEMQKRFTYDIIRNRRSKCLPK